MGEVEKWKKAGSERHLKISSYAIQRRKQVINNKIKEVDTFILIILKYIPFHFGIQMMVFLMVYHLGFVFVFLYLILFLMISFFLSVML